MAKRHKESITRRWITNSVGVVFVILLVITVTLILGIRQYYYNSVSQYLSAQMNVVMGTVTRYAEDFDTNFSSELRNIIENYENKEKIELMAVDIYGNTAITSSGFAPSDNTSIEDYSMAVESENGKGKAVFRLPTGEKVMAMTQMIPMGSNEYEAVRMLVSLKKVNEQVFVMSLIIIGVAVAIMVFVFASGMYFVRSIVYPVMEIGEFAKNMLRVIFLKELRKNPTTKSVSFATG